MLNIKAQRILLILSILLILLGGIARFKYTDNTLDDSRDTSGSSKEKLDFNVKSSAFWDENDVRLIHILGDNWSATDLPWIQNKTGTWDDPHIIENVTINGQNSISCILIENSIDHFIIRNCTLYNAGPRPMHLINAGIYISDSNNGRLIDNNCSNNEDGGIYVASSNNMEIKGNKLSGNAHGIYILAGWGGNSTNINITDNTVNYNDNGIQLQGSPYPSGDTFFTTDINIINNTVIGNNLTGINLIGYNHYINISKNTVSHNLRGIFVLGGKNPHTGGPTNHNVTVVDNSLINNKHGIELFGISNEIDIIDNTKVEKNEVGIYVVLGTGGANIIGNAVNNNNKSGIFIRYTANHILRQNTANYNGKYGIRTYSTSDTTIYDNTVNHNEESGIFLNKSYWNNITENTASYNEKYGIVLNSSYWNNITENTANYNYCGINLTSSSYNTITGNDLRCNTVCFYNDTLSIDNTIENNICGPCPGPSNGDGDGNGNGDGSQEPDFTVPLIIVGISAIGAAGIGIFILKKRR